MKIKKVHFKNFKRFTDLSLENIPENAKLVLLIGANGSGKSSVFDGFIWLSKSLDKEDEDYYLKNPQNQTDVLITFEDGESISKGNFEENKNYFYGRSSIRIVPKIEGDGRTLSLMATDKDAPRSSIMPDFRFVNDVYAYILQINETLLSAAIRGHSVDSKEVFLNYIEPLNQSLKKIFEETGAGILQIVDLKNATPDSSPKLIFQKGESKINYDLLSHGEKQVITILLNFIVRRKNYEDSIIFIDEMDCHLNTALQETLLQEIVEKWIPDSSQLWTASHALGFIDYARKAEKAVILDLDSYNFDVPQTITPQSKEILDVYDIAIPKSILSQLFSDKKIVFCENQNDEYYNLLCLPKVIFVGLKDSRDVFLQVKRDIKKYALRDRDFLSDDEIIKIQTEYPKHRILGYYAFENYLYHPDNIAELKLKGFDKKVYTNNIIEQKNKRVDYTILPKLISSRAHYEEFKTDEMKDENVFSIVDDLKSDEFEKFYKFFDMKKEFNKEYLSKFNLSTEKLASTKWFRNKIENLLKPNRP